MEAENRETPDEDDQGVPPAALPVFFHNLMAQIRNKSLAEAEHTETEPDTSSPSSSCAESDEDIPKPPSVAILEPGEIPTQYSKCVKPTAGLEEVDRDSELCKNRSDPTENDLSEQDQDSLDDRTMNNGSRNDGEFSQDSVNNNKQDSGLEPLKKDATPILITPVDDDEDSSSPGGVASSDNTEFGAATDQEGRFLMAGAFPNLCSQLGLSPTGPTVDETDNLLPEMADELHSIPPLQNIMTHFANQAALFANQAAHFASQVAHFASHAVIETADGGNVHEPTNIPAEFPNLIAHLMEAPHVDQQPSALNPIAPFTISPTAKTLPRPLPSKSTVAKLPKLKANFKLGKKSKMKGFKSQQPVTGILKKEEGGRDLIDVKPMSLMNKIKSDSKSEIFGGPKMKVTKKYRSSTIHNESHELSDSLSAESSPDEPLDLKIRKNVTISYPELISQLGKTGANLKIDEAGSSEETGSERTFYHRGSAEKSRNTGRNPSECPVCFKVFAAKRHYYEHMRAHEGVDKFICKDCGKAYASMKRLQIHSKHHRDLKPFTCTDCGKGFTMSSNLVNHMRIHTGEKPFVCQVCNQGFTQKGNLKRHIVTHKASKGGSDAAKGDRTALVCPMCRMEFPTPTSMRSHHVISPLCQKYNDAVQNVEQSGSKSSEDDKLRCEQCSQDFETQDALKSHIGTCQFAEPATEYSCQNCEATFSQMAELKQHQFVHTDSNSYQCDVCLRVYSDVRTLRTHMWTHGGEKEFKCEECGKEFTQKANLNSHKRLKHPNIKNDTKATEAK